MNHVDQSPAAPALLDDALELAEIIRPTWPAISEETRRTAAFLNEGEEETDTGEGQPSPDGTDSQLENNGGGEGSGESSFLDDYDLGGVPEAAQPAVEAWVKNLQAGYTRQRQADTQAVREAEQAQSIIDGLVNPATRANVAQALGLELAPEEEEELDDEFDFRDPRVDDLLAKQQQSEQLSAARERIGLENQYVTEQIEGLEDKLGLSEDAGTAFSDEELSLLYLLADENRDQKGVPSVEAAYRILAAAGSSYRVRATKVRPKPPRRLGGGGAGEQTVDLSDPEARVEAMARAGAAAMASSQ